MVDLVHQTIAGAAPLDLVAVDRLCSRDVELLQALCELLLELFADGLGQIAPFLQRGLDELQAIS
jgi:hypothetical protein